jgi:hypothetical protein
MFSSPRASSAVITLPMALLAAACGSADGPAANEWQITRATVPGGAAHVVNVPPAGDVEPTWGLEEELRIGSVEGTDPTVFGMLKGLAVLRDGRIAVLDGQARELRVFGPDGGHLATHGRPGRGPGEIEDAWGMMMDADDRLWVADSKNARMSVFDPADGLVRDHSLQVTSWGFWWDGTILEDGRILLPAYTVGPEAREILRVYDREMNVVDSLPLAVRRGNPAEDPGTYVFEGGRGSRMFTSVPFYPGRERILDPRGGAWSTPSGDPSYRIAHWMPGGDTTLVIETQRPRVAVTTAERDSAIENLRAAAARIGAQPADWSRIPAIKPSIASMFVADDGRLWVRTHSATGTEYDVYERDGGYAGTVATPLDLLPRPTPVVRGEHVWAVVQDDLDVQYVIRARMVPRSDAAPR